VHAHNPLGKFLATSFVNVSAKITNQTARIACQKQNNMTNSRRLSTLFQSHAKSNKQITQK